MVSYLRSHQLFHFIDGTTTYIPQFFFDHATLNLKFVTWTQTDQMILSTLISSLSDNLIAKMVGYSTSWEVWSDIEKLFASQSYARII